MTNHKYNMNNIPINISNIYKYLINLYKLEIIPYFNVEFNDDLTEIIFTFEYENNNKWGKIGTSTIMYNINTKLWTSRFNTMTENKYLVLQSEHIEDILEPSLNSFDIKYSNNNKYNLMNLVDVNNQEIHNIKYIYYYTFINNLIKTEKINSFNKYKLMNDSLYEHIWEKVYSNYEKSIKMLSFNSFLQEYIFS